MLEIIKINTNQSLSFKNLNILAISTPTMNEIMNKKKKFSNVLYITNMFHHYENL